MSLDELKMQLSEFGDVQIAKSGYVFTILMTSNGKNLSKYKTVLQIQHLIFNFCGSSFTSIEVFRNDTNFFCIVLKPSENELRNL
jgi:hypothetical protein